MKALPMKLALSQIHSPAGDRATALASLRSNLEAAAAAGVEMLVLPELFLPGYNVADMTAVSAQSLGAELGELARETGCGLTVGFAEASDGARYNSALAIAADGTVLCHYRKVQLFGPREKRLFKPGSGIPTFELGGQKAAVLICYDIEFAPHVAALAAAGVTLILVPTANMLPFTHVARVTVPAMAANHAVAIVYANYCGSEGDLVYSAESLIVGRDGAVLAQAGDAPALLSATLPAQYDPALLSTQLADYTPVPVN
jgi:5-aminopentanamidase